jgi:peptide/nickel transport system substrate-binding protein
MGGRVVVHLETPVASFNALLDNSAVTSRLLHELHEPLLHRDWESWEFVPRLARAVWVEDTVVLASGERLFGRVERGEAELSVTPAGGPAHPLTGPRSVPAAEVAQVLPETVFTFELRDDVLWHDGHRFDSGDVEFTFRCAKNPHVPCPRRFAFDKLERCEVLGPFAVRFTLARPYFLARAVFEGLPLQPAHRLDLSDPDNPDHRPGASEAEQGRYLVEHPLNQLWIGLGPYRLTEAGDAAIDAERFDGYFDPEHGGHFDAVRWRIIRDDHTAFRALIEGELDFTNRLLVEDYFGAEAASAEFRERFYTGSYFTPALGYTVWNTARPPFDDPRVRRALGHAFDWDAFNASFYGGLGMRVTSEVFPGNPNYDPSVEPLAHDANAARALLAEAGWYDRDGDGLVDRDGEPLSVELLLAAGSISSQAYGQKLALDLSRLGVRLTLLSRDLPALLQQVDARDFDGAHLAWFMPVDSDPEQLWHSRWKGPGGSNYGSFSDPEADRLIEALQVELDAARRAELFHRLQRLVHGQQVYSYGLNVPRRFAASRRLRNVQLFAIEPGYSLRRWYFEDGG